MKVYIVTDGEYSDYHIEAVFTDEKTAYKYAALHKCNNVEEYDTDSVTIDGDFTPYMVYGFNYNGKFCFEWDSYWAKEKITGVRDVFGQIKVYVSLEKPNQKKAEKIAEDMYAKWKYEKGGE